MIFTGPPAGADVLALRGVSVVSTANNHAWDYGKSALLETIDNLTRAQVPFAGTGRDAERAYAPVVLRVKARSIALFAVTHIWNNGAFLTHEGRDHVAWCHAESSTLRRARTPRADFVLMSYHGGEEYVPAPSSAPTLRGEMMALGVDAVSVITRRAARHWLVEGRPIVYSLGNFVFAGHDNRPWTRPAFLRGSRCRRRVARGPRLPVALEGSAAFVIYRRSARFERFRLHMLTCRSAPAGQRSPRSTSTAACASRPSLRRSFAARARRRPVPAGPSGNERAATSKRRM